MSITSGPQSGLQSGLRSGLNPSSASGPTISTDKSSYTVGESIQVTWSGASTTTDYLNQAAPASADTTVGANWIYCNSGTQTAGGAVQASGTRAMTSVVGTFQLRLMANDGFVVLARSATITVT